MVPRVRHLEMEGEKPPPKSDYITLPLREHSHRVGSSVKNILQKITTSCPHSHI